MAKTREVKTLAIQEAMNNLAAIVGIDLEHPPLMGIIRNHQLITDSEEVGSQQVAWLSGEGGEKILEILDMTFYTIHQHLMAISKNSETNWSDAKVRKGIEAMVTLAEEAADKMNHYLAFRLGKKLSMPIQERPSFQELHFFYHNRFSKKMQKSGEIWSEEWEENEQGTLLDVSKSGLKDFESVKRDLEYELFSIRNEDGKPYFNPGLLRNIRLACFEAGKEVSFEEDPLLRVRTMEDRDLQASAKQILFDCEKPIGSFYKIAKRLHEVPFAQYLSMSLTALYLSSNPRNLIQNTSNKSSLLYFHDFQMFLRRAMNTDDYQKYIAYLPGKEDKIADILLDLTHSLSQSLFYRLGGVKQEAVGLIHRCMRKGEEADRNISIKGDSIWSQLWIDDEKFRVHLEKFPNGPLFKILDLIRDEELELMVFDPLLQENIPQKVFELQGKKPIHILRMACPTKQSLIHKATLSEEFRGLLRFYGSCNPKKKHLMINLQDRTSWQEFARCQTMEKLQKNAEFNDQLVVISLPKSTDFYHQINEYLNISKAAEFIEQFQEQLKSPEECGFFLPSSLKGSDWSSFVQKGLNFVHRFFFDQKESLSRRNREDFIEIFYQLIVLKAIEQTEPDSLSFTCKDAIDTGAAALATFFGFIQILNEKMEGKELDSLRLLFYAPALFIRERGIDPERLSRSISALERIDHSIKSRGSKLKKELFSLFEAKWISSLKIRHL